MPRTSKRQRPLSLTLSLWLLWLLGLGGRLGPDAAETVFWLTGPSGSGPAVGVVPGTRPPAHLLSALSSAQESAENAPRSNQTQTFLACRSELGRELEALLRWEVLEAEDFPVGDYVVISLAKVMVGPSKELSPPPFLKELAKGETVEVLEVQALPQEGRIRGRMADGWISLQNLDSGFRWAWPKSLQEEVTQKLAELTKITRSSQDPELLEADLLYLKALLGRLSVGLPALKSFQSNSPSKTWALFGRGLEQWDSVAGDHSYEVPLTKVSEPLRRELFRALGSKAYMRDLVQTYTQDLAMGSAYGDFLERFRKVKDALLTEIGGASGLSGLSLKKALSDKTDSSRMQSGSWTQEDIAQWLQVFTAITSSTRVFQADVYFGHATFGLCLRRLMRRFELALSLQKETTETREAEAAPSELLVLENFRNFVEMVSRPSSEDATMDEVLKLSTPLLSAIRRQTESLFGKGLREELQVPLDRASSLINDPDDSAPTTPPIGKMASLLLEAAEAGELRMLSVSKMGAKERTMWDALSFGYFLQEAEDDLLLAQE